MRAASTIVFLLPQPAGSSTHPQWKHLPIPAVALQRELIVSGADCAQIHDRLERRDGSCESPRSLARKLAYANPDREFGRGTFRVPNRPEAKKIDQSNDKILRVVE